jgi:DnaK suppressor protein
MDSNKKAFFKTKILAEIEVLKEKIIELKEITQPIAPENAIGRISRMDAINNKSVNEAALRTAENKFKKLAIALSKVDEENFGNCTRCNQPIPEGRLMIMPESNLCVNCAQR